MQLHILLLYSVLIVNLYTVLQYKYMKYQHKEPKLPLSPIIKKSLFMERERQI